MILKKLKLELIHNKFNSIEKKKHLKFALVVYNQKTFANFQKKLLQLVFQLEFVQIGDKLHFKKCGTNKRLNINRFK